MSDIINQSYQFTPEGIMKMSDVDVLMTFATLMGHTEDVEQRESLETAIRLAFRTPSLNYEQGYKVIDAFCQRFKPVISQSLEKICDLITPEFTGKTPDGEPMDYQEWLAMRQIQQMGMGSMSPLFEQHMFGDWINRKLVVDWFFNEAVREDDTAPTEIKNGEFGKGLFASRDIKRGELIAYYPMDWVADSHLCPIQDNGDPYSTEQQKWICIQNGAIIGYGNPNMPDDAERIMNENREAAGGVSNRLMDYGYSFAGQDGYVHIWGDPECKHKNSWFRGHIINDGAYHKGQTQDGYDKMFQEAQCGDANKINCRLSTRITADRDIKKGEEILTAYGSDYWFGGIMSPQGVKKEYDPECYTPKDAAVCRDAMFHMNTGQKKKAKKQKQDIAEQQIKTFNLFRDHIAKKEHVPDNNQWRVCITNVDVKEGALDVEAVVVSGMPDREWVEGDPTQFYHYYQIPH